MIRRRATISSRRAAVSKPGANTRLAIQAAFAVRRDRPASTAAGTEGRLAARLAVVVCASAIPARGTTVPEARSCACLAVERAASSIGGDGAAPAATGPK